MKATVLFLLLSFFTYCCYLSLAANDIEVKLITIDTCNRQLATETDAVSIGDFLQLQMETSKVPMKVPNWLRLVCMKIDCSDKVFKISNCFNNDVSICFFWKFLWKVSTPTTKQALA